MWSMCLVGVTRPISAQCLHTGSRANATGRMWSRHSLLLRKAVSDACRANSVRLACVREAGLHESQNLFQLLDLIWTLGDDQADAALYP